MPYTQTDLIRYIHMQLGAYLNPIEITDEEIMDIVKNETLPIFSKYFPYIIKHLVNQKLDNVPNKRGVFYIKTDYDLLGVTRMWINNYIYSPHNMYVASGLDPVAMKLTSDYLSYTENPPIFNFIPPNVLEIFPKYFSYYQEQKILLEIKVIHPSHLNTIPPMMFDQFHELAKCDVFIALFNIRKFYSQITTTFGNIEFAIDRFEVAKDERKELIEKFHLNYFKSPNRKKLFIY
jgi:hypothetical protein